MGGGGFLGSVAKRLRARLSRPIGAAGARVRGILARAWRQGSTAYARALLRGNAIDTRSRGPHKALRWPIPATSDAVRFGRARGCDDGPLTCPDQRRARSAAFCFLEPSPDRSCHVHHLIRESRPRVLPACQRRGGGAVRPVAGRTAHLRPEPPS